MGLQNGDAESSGALGDQGHSDCEMMTQQRPNAFVGTGNWKQKHPGQQSGVTAQHYQPCAYKENGPHSSTLSSFFSYTCLNLCQTVKKLKWCKILSS